MSQQKTAKGAKRERQKHADTGEREASRCKDYKWACNKGVQLAKDEEIAQSLRSSVKERLSIDFRKLSVQESQSS